MALLISSNEEGSRYSLAFELTRPQIHVGNIWEGWLYYELTLKRDEGVINSCDGTIIDGDVEGFISCFTIGQQTEEKLEPMEPDFLLQTERFDDPSILVACIIDDGHAQSGIYNSCGVGLHFTVDDFAAQAFANEVSAKLDSLIAGLHKTD